MKNLVSQKCECLKIIAVGDLNKRLIVHADSCTERARDAIINAGGKVDIYDMRGDN